MPEASPVSLPRVHPFARVRTGHSTHTTSHTCPTSALLAHCPGERGMETTTTRRPAESRRRDCFSCLSKSPPHNWAKTRGQKSPRKGAPKVHTERARAEGGVCKRHLKTRLRIDRSLSTYMSMLIQDLPSVASSHFNWSGM